MKLRVMLIGLAAVALLVGVLELASIATERLTGAPVPASSVSTERVEPGLPSAPEIEDDVPVPNPAVTH